MGKKKQKKLKPATAEGLELISACERGDIPKIKELIKNKVDVICEGPRGITPLIAAAMHDKSEAMKVLIMAQPVPELDHQMENGNTALHECVLRDNCRTTAVLFSGLKQDGTLDIWGIRADPNLRNSEGETPLHLFQRLNQDLLLMFTKQYALFTIYDNKKLLPVDRRPKEERDEWEHIVLAGRSMRAEIKANNPPPVKSKTCALM